MLWVALTGIIYFGTTLIALSQDLIPLEQYVREYFERKKAFEAWQAAASTTKTYACSDAACPLHLPV